jgi:BirA family biotin operon repressor/biotin-[acetyl-CoA-carboxylase] ligase
MRLLPEPAPANVIWLDEVDSTNAVAERLVAEWLANEDERLSETLIVADRQSAGRGRGDHVWESPAGGLYATWLAWLPLPVLATLPMAVAVSLVAAVEDLVPGLRVGLRWPNDLLLDGRKLGGVLCESRSGSDAAWVMAGFGVNVESDPVLAPGDPTKPVSLRSMGFASAAGQAIRSLLAGFLARIHAALADPLSTGRAWADRTVHRAGEHMRLRLDTGVLEGSFVRVLEDGRIELRVGGELRRFPSGELLVDTQPGG